MNILTYIEELYEKWDGTEPHAALILRHIHLAMYIAKVEPYKDNDDE